MKLKNKNQNSERRRRRRRQRLPVFRQMCPDNQNFPESLRSSPFSALTFLPQDLQDEINSIEEMLSRSPDDMPQGLRNLFPIPEHTRHPGVIGTPAVNNLDNPMKPRSPSPVYFLPKDLMDEINNGEIWSPIPNLNGEPYMGERPMTITPSLPATITSRDNFLQFSMSHREFRNILYSEEELQAINPNEFSSSCNIPNNTNGYVVPLVPYTMQNSVLRPIFNTSYINNASLQTVPNPQMEQINYPLQHPTPRPILHKNYTDDQINPVSPRPILNRNFMDALPAPQNIVEDPRSPSEGPYVPPIYVISSNYRNGFPSEYLLQNPTPNEINPVMNGNGEFVELYTLPDNVPNQPLNENFNGGFQVLHTESAIPLLSGYHNGDFQSMYVPQSTEEIRPALSGSCNGEFQATYILQNAVEGQLNTGLQNTYQHPQFPVPLSPARPVLNEMCYGEYLAPNPQTQLEMPPSTVGPVFNRNVNGEFLEQAELNSVIIKPPTQLDVPYLSVTPLFNTDTNGELPAAYKLQNLIIDPNSLTNVVHTYMQFTSLPSSSLINYQTVPGQQNPLTNPTNPNTHFTEPVMVPLMTQNPEGPINYVNGVNPMINYTNPYMLPPEVAMPTPEGNWNREFLTPTRGDPINHVNGVNPMINYRNPYTLSPRVIRPKTETNYNGESTGAYLSHNPVNNQLQHTNPHPMPTLPARPVTNRNGYGIPPGFIKREPAESSDSFQEGK